MQWSVDLHPVTGEWRIIDREGEIVCVSLRGEQHLATIAAAPDMFEAIKAALDSAVLFGRVGDEAISKEAMSALRAALAKASPSSRGGCA